MFWKKPKTKLNSDEYEILTRKLVAMVGDIDIITGRITFLASDFKKLTARLHSLKREQDEAREDSEEFKKDEVVRL